MSLFAGPEKPLKPLRTVALPISEPSDIALNATQTGYFVVGDGGTLHEIDLEGKLLRTANYKGQDFEGVLQAPDGHVMAVEERSRQVLQFRAADFELVNTYKLPYSGAINKGYESLVWNDARKRFALYTEKDPALLLEFTADWQPAGRQKLEGITEVSAMTMHNNNLYVLSDEEHTVYVLDAATFARKASFSVQVWNPEGIAFAPDGHLVIVSDDLERMYWFDLPENAK